MKEYPSIESNINNKSFYKYKDLKYHFFDKLDGNNIRSEFSKKKGFYKFGSRHQLITSDSQFSSVPDILKAKFEKDLSDIFAANKIEQAICFFEYHGPNSFAGNHNPNEEQTLTLLDVNPYKQPIMESCKFIQLFGHLDIPKVLKEDCITQENIDVIYNNQLPGITFEGVVCKSFFNKQHVMIKFKTKQWYDKLKVYCKDDQKLYNTLK